MLEYFLKRTILLIPKILIISLIIFIGIQLVPGDAADYLIPASKAAELGPEALEELRESLGLNDGYLQQYIRWLGNMLKGDFGYSHINGVAIKDLIVARLPITMELCLIALVFSTFFGILFGFIAAVRHNKPSDFSLTALGMAGISIPEFFFGLILILVFAFYLKVLPSGGRVAPGQTGFFQRIDHLVLPCACMGVGLVSNLLLNVKNSMLDTLNMEYVRTARSKGLSPTKVYVRHGFRNAMIPIASILIGRITILFGGSTAIESVFNFPGMGKLLLDSINNNDMPTVMVTTFILTIVVLIATLLIDIAAALLDPRIRMGEEGM